MSNPAIESFDIVTKIRQILVRYEQILETLLKTVIKILPSPQPILTLETNPLILLQKQHPSPIFQSLNLRQLCNDIQFNNR